MARFYVRGAPMSANVKATASWVQKTPGVCGGRACIRNTRITVWRLGNSGRGGQGISDALVLADALAEKRALLTHNHPDFKRLHRQGQPHEGIVSCTQDKADPSGLAHRIDAAIAGLGSLANQFIRVIRPNP